MRRSNTRTHHLLRFWSVARPVITAVVQGQLPPFGIACAAESPAHFRSHVALEQLTEQEPVQVMWQMEFPLQETLPLAPSVAVHVELPVQSTLHESRHAPLHAV